MTVSSLGAALGGLAVLITSSVLETLDAAARLSGTESDWIDALGPDADRSALSILGFIFSGVAATVTLIAYLVVRDHVDGHLSLETNSAITVSTIQ